MTRLLPLAGSTHAPDLDTVLLSVHLHMAIQALAWGAFFVYCVIRFRRRAHPRATYHGLPPAWPIVAIGLVIVGDALVLTTSALPAWHARSAPPTAAAPIEVRVVAEQFAWNVHYPGPDGRFGETRSPLISDSNPLGIDRRSDGGQDDVGLLNILTVPVGRTIVVHLSSRDVVHSFTLNEMRVKQDATPGMVVRTWFTPTATGRWDIACSQLCGLGHYRMRGALSVLTVPEWEVWQQRELSLVAQAQP